MAQTNQVFHMQQLAKARGAVFPSFMDPTIKNYKDFLAAQVEMDEQGSDPLHPVNATINNPNLANIDSQILAYLCEIDITFCAGGPNYPLR